MSQKWLLASIGAFFFIQFVIFSFLVHKDLFTRLDFDTTVHLQDDIGRNWDREFSLLSDVGKFEVSIIILLAIFILTRKVLAGVVALFFFGMFHFIELFGKHFVSHPPPPQFMLRTEQIFSFPQFHVSSEYSYPSGHSGRAVFLSIILLTIIWQIKRFNLPVKLLLTGLIVGYNVSMFVSRVTLGEHWTTDVVGGAFLGAACGFLSGVFLVNKQTHLVHDKNEKKESKRLIPKFKIEIKKVE